MDGSKSYDPDDNGDTITYSWNQTQGPAVELNDADYSMATFATPHINNASKDTDLVFKLTVKDRKNATSTDDVKVTVKHVVPPNKVSIADAGVDKTANEGDILSLDGTKSRDTGGNITSYSWRQVCP